MSWRSISGVPPPSTKQIKASINGDLWIRIHDAILALRGYTATAEWVKGHTTLEDVDNGIISLLNHYGNSGADRLATKGAEAHAISQDIKLSFIYRKQPNI